MTWESNEPCMCSTLCEAPRGQKNLYGYTRLFGQSPDLLKKTENNLIRRNDIWVKWVLHVYHPMWSLSWPKKHVWVYTFVWPVARFVKKTEDNLRRRNDMGVKWALHVYNPMWNPSWPKKHVWVYTFVWPVARFVKKTENNVRRRNDMGVKWALHV